MNSDTPIIPIVSPEQSDTRPVAIYVHGLASGAAGTTITSLARKLKRYRWITTDFGENIERNVELLNSMIRSERPALIVGTSLGGLTVLYADAPDAVKVVCNPALSIADSVRHTIGLGWHDYFCERQDGVQSFELTEQMCSQYENYISRHAPLLGKESYAIFAAHDELLGDEASCAAQQAVAASGYTVLIDPKGVHRITSSTIKLIGGLVAV